MVRIRSPVPDKSSAVRERIALLFCVLSSNIAVQTLNVIFMQIHSCRALHKMRTAFININQNIYPAKLCQVSNFPTFSIASFSKGVPASKCQLCFPYFVKNDILFMLTLLINLLGLPLLAIWVPGKLQSANTSMKNFIHSLESKLWRTPRLAP